MRLAGKTALITGAATGLGEAIASGFIREGANVIVSDIDEAAGAQSAASLGARARFVRLDVRDEKAWVGALESAGKIDILVNNAGVVSMANIEEVTLDTFRRDMDVDVLGVLLGCKHGIAAMRAAGGSIINLSSAVAARAEPEMVAYSGAKAAVSNITRAVALHCARRGYPIRCNAILPGIIHTKMLDRALAQMPDPNEALARWKAKQPMGRLGKVGEVTALAVYLASDDSSFTTGAEMLVDGGNTL